MESLVFIYTFRGTVPKKMKKFFTWLMYVAAFFSGIIILLFIYLSVDPFRKQKQRKLYYKRIEEIKTRRNLY